MHSRMQDADWALFVVGCAPGPKKSAAGVAVNRVASSTLAPSMILMFLLLGRNPVGLAGEAHTAGGSPGNYSTSGNRWNGGKSPDGMGRQRHHSSLMVTPFRRTNSPPSSQNGVCRMYVIESKRLTHQGAKKMMATAIDMAGQAGIAIS